jgi:hypothetical protein
MKGSRSVAVARIVACLAGALALGIYVLHVHRDALFWHLDGYMVRQTIEGQFKWLRPSMTLGLDPLRGPGSLFFPVNFRLLPVIAIQQIVFAGHISGVFTYIGYAVQTIFMTCLLARYCYLSLRVGVLAGLILAMLAMPLVWTVQSTLMFPIFLLAPFFFDLLAFGVLFFVVYGHIGRGSAARSISCSMLCFGITFWAMASIPMPFVMLVPFVFAVMLAYLLMTTGAERLAKCAATASILAALYLSGAIEFASGMIASGALSVFGSEIDTYQFGRWWSSIAHQYDRFPAGAVLASCGTLVASAAVHPSIRRFANTGCKVAALVTGALGIFFLVAWSLIEQIEVVSRQLRHVRLFYFELVLLPFYALFAALGLDRGLQVLARRFPRGRLVADTVVGLIVIVAVTARLQSVRDTNPWPQPAGATPITELLKNVIGVEPGSTFRGRVATILSPTEAKHPAHWDRLVAHDAARYRVQQNDHRFVGLWAFQIPTLQEYSQILTPGTYFWITRAMSAAWDKQDMRNHAIITRPDIPLMKLFGVRYVIDSQPRENAELTFVATSAAGDLLYELADVNLGQYYARHVARANNFDEMLHGMGSTASLLETTWVYEDVPSALSSARVEIRFVAAGIRVTGKSDGTALMLLPFTFSRCFAVNVRSGDQAARMVRANLNMLGLLFTDSVDAELTLATGPFTRPTCLLDEAREVQRLGLDRVARGFSRGSLAAPD